MPSPLPTFEAIAAVYEFMQTPEGAPGKRDWWINAYPWARNMKLEGGFVTLQLPMPKAPSAGPRP